MKKKDYSPFEEKVAACWEGAEGVYSWRELDVDTDCTDERMKVSVSQMFEYLPLSFTVMKKLAEVFGTTDYTVNNWSHSGCETCDYGSTYCHEFSYKKG